MFSFSLSPPFPQPPHLAYPHATPPHLPPAAYCPCLPLPYLITMVTARAAGGRAVGCWYARGCCTFARLPATTYHNLAIPALPRLAEHAFTAAYAAEVRCGPGAARRAHFTPHFAPFVYAPRYLTRATLPCFVALQSHYRR